MTKSPKVNEEMTQFFTFQKHLCEGLSNLKNYTSQINFLNEQNKNIVNDFFYSNLFLLYLCTYNKDISQEIRESINHIWEDIKLYHYTDSPSLEKIISTETLKLNNILKMNDSDEGQALVKNISKLFEDDKNLAKINNWMQKITNIQKNIYSFSFTTLKDDASQWDRYGRPKKLPPYGIEHKPSEIEKNPCGICLEISMKNLLKFVEKNKKDFDLAELTPILYLQNYNTDNTYLKFIKSIICIRIKKENSNEVAKYVAYYSSNIKHESFKKEYEVRLLLSLKNEDNKTNIPNYIKQTSNDNEHHIILNLAENLPNFSFSDLFSSITFGPGTSKEAERNVEDLLSKYNLTSLLSDDSKHSKCTLR